MNRAQDAQKLAHAVSSARDRSQLYADLPSAGRQLATALAAHKGAPHTIILTLVRGGVLVAREVARALELPMDLVFLRRLLAPRGPESPVCAVNVAGNLWLDPELDVIRQKGQPGLEFFLEEALQAFSDAEKLCRNQKPPCAVADKTVLLIDNGLRTGRTVRLAIRAIRSFNPAKIIVAVPVGSGQAHHDVASVVDDFICLKTHDPFGHVGMWYLNYAVPDYPDISALLNDAIQSGAD